MAQIQSIQKAETQLIEQKITQRITITAGSMDAVTIPIPAQAKAYLKGYGYTYFANTIYRLNCGTLQFPSRSDQEGAVSIPMIYGNPYPITSGNINFYITNNDNADHTYDVVMYILCNRIIPINSTGGELILAIGSGGSSGAVTIYDSTITTAAGVTALGLAVNPSSPTALLSGTLTTASAAATVLASSTTCKKVIIQVDQSSDDIYIGNATSQNVRLVATQTIQLEVANLNTIYIKRTGTNNVTVNYIGS